MGRDSNQLQQFKLNRDLIAEEMQRVIRKLGQVEHYIGQTINKKAILKKAGKPVLKKLQTDAPRDKGNLQESMAFLNFRKDKQAVYVGPRYNARTNSEGALSNKIAPHAHLVEFGWIDKNGNRHEGNPFIKHTYNSTKEIVLQNLNNEIQKVIDKAISNVKIR